MTTPKAKPRASDRLAASAEVAAYVHWRLAQIMGEGPRPDVGEVDWLMGMLGSAAADLLEMSGVPKVRPARAAKPRRLGPKGGGQGALDLAEPISNGGTWPRPRLVYSRAEP